MPVKWW